jgi:flavin reductase (DIM6/NTAB) family NADH-FMN oxidoreductase RutF
MRAELTAEHPTATVGRHRVDDAVFVQLMAAFAGGVAVVTTIDEHGDPLGLTTTAVTSVSRDPPLLLVCVDRASRTLPALRHAGRFAVNFIAEPHAGVAITFASKAEDKFAELAWRASGNGMPVLDGYSHAWADCRVDQEIDAGDHVVLIAAVTHGGLVEEHGQRPLTYFRRTFGGFAPST